MKTAQRDLALGEKLGAWNSPKTTFQSKPTNLDAIKLWGYLSRPLKVPLHAKIFSSLSSSYPVDALI